MNSLLSHLGNLGALLLWVSLWGLGGLWLVRNSFHLEKNEEFLAGIGIGIILQTFFINILGQIMPAQYAFWAGPAVVFALGLGFSFPLSSERFRSMFHFDVSIGLVFLLLVLIFIFTEVGRGLAILDDYQNLPETSLIAAGNIPPQFALDPAVRFDYHYFSLLLAGQMMRLFDLHAWNSLDLSRAIGLSISLMLSALWFKRVTRSAVAGLLGAMMGLFSGGTRWLMLLLPPALLKTTSTHINMIGSGAATATNLFEAMVSPLGIDGAGNFPLPFAYFNGINGTQVWTMHSGAGTMGGIIVSFLLLSHNRWRSWRGAVVTMLLIASRTLLSETSIVSLGMGLVIISVIYAVQHKTWKLPKSLWRWFVVLIPAGIIAAVQGGVLTGIVLGILARLSGKGGPSYFTFSFSLRWPPAFLSSHLGLLSFNDPYQILVALCEIGPLIILLPLALIWGWKAYRSGRWYEAALVVMPLIYVATLFIEYTGNAGPTALNRVQGSIISLSQGGFALATLWYWAKSRADWAKVGSALLLFVSMFGGILLFGLELLSVPQPVYSYYLDTLDARVEEKYWNKLEADALIFDPNASRPAVIFARATDSHKTWYVAKPEWEGMVSKPDPYQLRAAGFDYIFVGRAEWDRHGDAYEQLINTPCVKLVDEIETNEPTYDFRRLMDIQGCTP